MLKSIKNLVKRNSIYFKFIKKQHYKKQFPMNPNLAEDKSIFKELSENGLVLIPNFFSEDIVDKIYSECIDPITH